MFCLKHKTNHRPLARPGGCSSSSPVCLCGLVSRHFFSPDSKILASGVASSWSLLLHRFFKLTEGYKPLERPIFTLINKEVVEKDLSELLWILIRSLNIDLSQLWPVHVVLLAWVHLTRHPLIWLTLPNFSGTGSDFLLSWNIGRLMTWTLVLTYSFSVDCSMSTQFSDQQFCHCKRI